MNPEKNSHKCFIIHLKRAAKRKKTVKSIILNMECETEIIDAIDGSTLTARYISKFINYNNRHHPKYPFTVNKGEIGCFLSHREAWKAIVNEKLEAGFIIEDDCEIDIKKFEKSLKIALKLVKKLGYIQFQTREIPNNAYEINNIDGVQILQPKTIPLRTSAQLISYDAALLLLEKSKNIDRPVDGFLQLFWLTGQNISCIHPSGLSDITQISGGSTLSIKQSTKASITRSLIRFLYRVKIRIYSEIYKKILIKDLS
ncbi:glycosyltransferase family 25 protein [Amylibacter sp.]|nr:glycosyltransferase family 25 protein [Amylibacter sp.]